MSWVIWGIRDRFDCGGGRGGGGNLLKCHRPVKECNKAPDYTLCRQVCLDCTELEVQLDPKQTLDHGTIHKEHADASDRTIHSCTVGIGRRGAVHEFLHSCATGLTFVAEVGLILLHIMRCVEIT